MVKDALNKIYYLYKRNNWLLDLSRFWNNFDNIKIDRPIFLLGTHGGGLTLVSRMLRRHRDIVSVSGNYKYWSGADEMEIVLGPILPFQFTGTMHKIPSQLQYNHYTTNWLYATNEFLSYYRNTEKDVTPELAFTFKKTIKWLINRYAINKESARFTDKSQVYTLKVSFLNEILKDSDPKFILIVRNPYAMCYRAFKKEPALQYLKKTLSEEKVFEYAACHWLNSVKYALEDSGKVSNFMIVKYEDVLREPEYFLQKICNFIEISFYKDMVPQKNHKIPFGSRYLNEKWYPLRTDENNKYLKEMEKVHFSIINRICGNYIEMLGYDYKDI